MSSAVVFNDLRKNLIEFHRWFTTLLAVSFSVLVALRTNFLGFSFQVALGGLFCILLSVLLNVAIVRVLVMMTSETGVYLYRVLNSVQMGLIVCAGLIIGLAVAGSGIKSDDDSLGIGSGIFLGACMAVIGGFVSAVIAEFLPTRDLAERLGVAERPEAITKVISPSSVPCIDAAACRVYVLSSSQELSDK